MDRTSSCLAAAAIASALAGPLFGASLAAAGLYLQLPQPMVICAADLAIIGLMAMPALIVGFILSFVPNLIGAKLMTALAERSETARIPALWTVAGGLAGLGLAWAAGVTEQEDYPIAFALVLTSAACARICRWQMGWPWGWAQA